MNPRRTVSVLFAALAATMLVTGSFGFTSVSADRGVSVNVVDSENAYVGVSVCKESNGEGNGAKAEINVSNRFSDDFSVREITLGESEEPDWMKGSKDPIPPGESETFRVKAGNHDHVTVEVTGGLDASVTVNVSDDRCIKNRGKGKDKQKDKQNADGTPTPTAEPTERTTEASTPEADAE